MSPEELQSKLTHLVRQYGKKHLATARPDTDPTDAATLKDDIRTTQNALARSRQEAASSGEAFSHRDQLIKQMLDVRQGDRGPSNA